MIATLCIDHKIPLVTTGSGFGRFSVLTSICPESTKGKVKSVITKHTNLQEDEVDRFAGRMEKPLKKDNLYPLSAQLTAGNMKRYQQP